MGLCLSSDRYDENSYQEDERYNERHSLSLPDILHLTDCVGKHEGAHKSDCARIAHRNAPADAKRAHKDGE